jgi:hypothetical protein
MAEHRNINLALDKTIRVLEHAEPFKPSHIPFVAGTPTDDSV